MPYSVYSTYIILSHTQLLNANKHNTSFNTLEYKKRVILYQWQAEVSDTSFERICMRNCIHILWKYKNNGHTEYNVLLNQTFCCMNNKSNIGC